MRVDRPCRWERASRRFRQRVTQSRPRLVRIVSSQEWAPLGLRSKSLFTLCLPSNSSAGKDRFSRTEGIGTSLPLLSRLIPLHSGS
jgi:hypothetical protein